MRTRAATLEVWAALLAAMAAAMVVALAAGTETARAAFPGSNGAIAFQSDDHVYRMNSDGFGQTQLTDTGVVNLNPDWSSDGKKIAFTSVNTSGNDEVYWMNSDGSGDTNLTDHPASDSQPAFFPDYHTIAFARDPIGGDSDIFKMKADGTGTPVALTDTGAALELDPSWQPDP